MFLQHLSALTVYQNDTKMMIYKCREFLTSRHFLICEKSSESKRSLDWIWRHFSSDDVYTNISIVFCPASVWDVQATSCLSEVQNGTLGFSFCLAKTKERLLWFDSSEFALMSITFLLAMTSLGDKWCNLIRNLARIRHAAFAISLKKRGEKTESNLDSSHNACEMSELWWRKLEKKTHRIMSKVTIFGEIYIKFAVAMTTSKWQTHK